MRRALRVDECGVRTDARIRGWNAFDRLLAIAAITAGSAIALRAPGLGDYPFDAGPALSAIAHGQLAHFISHQPAMGAVSLYARAPFVALAALLHDSPVCIYRLGDLPCVLSVAFVSLWMARIAGARGTGRAGRALIVAICLANPLIGNALRLGHPEELLTASLAVGSLLAACERRVVLTAVLAGLAVASKQWALLVVCPALLVLERDRLRAGLLMAGVALASTLPMVIGSFGAFRHALEFLATPQSITTQFNWLYPISPTGTVRVSFMFGGGTSLSGHTAAGVLSAVSHPLIIALGVLVPLIVWLAHGRRLAAKQMLIATALVFVLRCVFDPWSQAYYHLPLLLTLVALDVSAGRELPLAGLAGAAGAFVVLDRFPDYLGSQAANLAYIATTVAAVAVLVRELRSSAPKGAARPFRPGGPHAIARTLKLAPRRR